MAAQTATEAENKPEIRLSKKKQALFALVIFVVFLLALEGALSWLGIPRGLKNDDGWAYMTDNAMGFEHTPGWSGYRAGAIVHINSAGWRGKDFSPAKPEGTIRILGVGDSFTFGRAVGDQDIYLAKLEEKLNRDGQGRYETINVGHENMNTRQELQYMQDRNMMALKPDVVVLGFTVHNDAQLPDNRYGRTLRRQMRERSTLLSVTESNFAKQVSKHSRIAEILRSGARWAEYDLITDLSYHIILSNYEDGAESWENCRNSLLGIYDLCRQHNVLLVMALFPIFKSDTNRTFTDYPQDFRNVHEKLRSVLDGKPGVVVVDVLDDLAATGLTINQLMVLKDGHPNALWHDLVAGKLRETLKGMGL